MKRGFVYKTLIYNIFPKNKCQYYIASYKYMSCEHGDAVNSHNL